MSVASSASAPGLRTPATGASRFSPAGSAATSHRTGGLGSPGSPSTRQASHQSVARRELASEGSASRGHSRQSPSGSQAGSGSEQDLDGNFDSQVFGSQFDSQNNGTGYLQDPESDMPTMNRSKSTPGPGQYVWNDQVSFRKKPSWTVSVPDRKNLDQMICSWTPATSSQQPRAPAPGTYEDMPVLGGKYGPPKWSYARASGRPCLARDPPKRAELALSLPSSLGGVSPALRRTPQWSVFGKDRSSLPYDTPTWTPKMNSDVRPGPGQHDVIRQPNWKPRNRRGCTWGGRAPLASKYPNLGQS